MSDPVRPADCVSSLRSIVSKREDLTNDIARLRDEKSSGTVIFFDLVGSTGYRREYGAEKGLEKAYVHNQIVSSAIENRKGYVVKWIGDGVLGHFPKTDLGETHSYIAFLAAVDALRTLAGSNENLENQDDEIHTKISLSAGMFHYFDVTQVLDSNEQNNGSASKTSSTARLDPMGSNVDLAARLNSIAAMDVILIDADTFWGTLSDDEEASISDPDRAVCGKDRIDINWRPVGLPEVRRTVYRPCVTAFFVEETGLKQLRSFQGGEDCIKLEDFEKMVDEERCGNGFNDAPAVYVYEPVPCNIRGFKKEVNVVAASLRGVEAPVQETVYSWESKELEEKLIKAERFFRDGQIEEALREYEEILLHDPRNYCANLRAGMIYRGENREKSLEHFFKAKNSNPKLPVAWAFVGMIHLENYLLDKSDSVSKAIVAFTNAKRLAAEQHDGLCEQYATCTLAQSLYIRGTNDDLNDADGLLQSLDNWPLKNLVVAVAKEVAEIFKLIAQARVESNDRSSLQHSAHERIEKLSTVTTELLEPDYRPFATPNQSGMPSNSYDNVIRAVDINNLGWLAQFRLNVKTANEYALHVEAKQAALLSSPTQQSEEEVSQHNS